MNVCLFMNFFTFDLKITLSENNSLNLSARAGNAGMVCVVINALHSEGQFLTYRRQLQLARRMNSLGEIPVALRKALLKCAWSLKFN